MPSNINLFTLTTLSLVLTTIQAQGVGNSAAVAACKGFPPGALKCLTDVSYVICTGTGKELEQFVAAGTHCEQGIPGQKLDAVNVAGIASTTRPFIQQPPYTAGVAPSPAPAKSSSAPPPPPPPSPASSAKASNTVQPINTDSEGSPDNSQTEPFDFTGGFATLK